MKRVYESGSQKRKRKQELEEAQKKLTKITNFISAKEKSQEIENSNSQVLCFTT